MKYIFTLLSLLLVNTVLFSQSIIKGEVLNDFGEKLQDTNVLVKGTTKGAKTVDGAFKIALNKGDTLSFSHLGYKTQEIVVKSFAPLKIVFEVETLDEVLIVAKPQTMYCSTSTRCSLIRTGCKLSCRGVAIKTIKSSQEYKNPVLFPNPVTSGYFNINFKEQYQHIAIAVYNTLGQIVLQRKEKSPGLLQEISISNLKTGIYLVKVSADGKELPTLRAVVK